MFDMKRFRFEDQELVMSDKCYTLHGYMRRVRWLMVLVPGKICRILQVKTN
jgi:hypothetical protein